MRIEVCPHCGSRVVPTTEGVCPSCRALLHDSTEPYAVAEIVNSKRSSPNEPAPTPEQQVVTCPNCSHVGRPVQRRGLFEGRELLLVMMLLFGSWVFLILSLILRISRNCAACARCSWSNGLQPSAGPQPSAESAQIWQQACKEEDTRSSRVTLMLSLALIFFFPAIILMAACLYIWPIYAHWYVSYAALCNVVFGAAVWSLAVGDGRDRMAFCLAFCAGFVWPILLVVVMVSTYWSNMPIAASYLVIIMLAASTAAMLARFLQTYTRQEITALSMATCFALALAGLPAVSVAWHLRINDPFPGHQVEHQANWLVLGLYLGITAILNVGLFILCRRATIATRSETHHDTKLR